MRLEYVIIHQLKQKFPEDIAYHIFDYLKQECHICKANRICYKACLRNYCSIECYHFI